MSINNHKATACLIIFVGKPILEEVKYLSAYKMKRSATSPVSVGIAFIAIAILICFLVSECKSNIFFLNYQMFLKKNADNENCVRTH